MIRAERRMREEEEWLIFPAVLIWQSMTEGTLLIYPLREKSPADTKTFHCPLPHPFSSLFISSMWNMKVLLILTVFLATLLISCTSEKPKIIWWMCCRHERSVSLWSKLKTGCFTITPKPFVLLHSFPQQCFPLFSYLCSPWSFLNIFSEQWRQILPPEQLCFLSHFYSFFKALCNFQQPEKSSKISPTRFCRQV